MDFLKITPISELKRIYCLIKSKVFFILMDNLNKFISIKTPVYTKIVSPESF